MRNGKSHIKISFRLRFFVREWRCDCDFPSDSLLSKSFFCFWTKNLFEFCSAKPLRPSPLPSKIDMDATPSQRSLPTAMSYFTQENSFWKWIWKTMGEVDLDFKWAISLGKLIFIIKIPTCNRVSKAPQASSMLILSRESKFALHFSSIRDRVTAIFNSNLTTWGKYFGVSSTVCCGLMHSGKPCPLRICKGLRSPEYHFQTKIDKTIVKWKAIHHHRADQNPHQRWSDLQRKPALHHPSDRGRDPLFSRASGASTLDAIRTTHSAEMGF